MLNKAVRGIAVLGTVGIVGAASLAMFLENSTGKFKELLVFGDIGIQLMGLAFIPLSLYLLLKAAIK